MFILHFCLKSLHQTPHSLMETTWNSHPSLCLYRTFVWSAYIRHHIARWKQTPASCYIVSHKVMSTYHTSKSMKKEVWCSAKWSQERNGCSRSTFPTMKDNMLYATYLKLKYASILQLYYMHIKDGSPHLHSSKTLLRLLLLCIIHLFYYNSF